MIRPSITYFILLSVLMSAVPTSAQQLKRTVISNGAVTARNGAKGAVQGTLGQGIVGFTRRSNTEAGVGFWYRPPKATTRVVIPSSEGDIGTTVKVPLILATSRNLLRDGPRDVVVKLRYNRTVLVHKGNQSVVFNGDDAIMTVTATVRDTVGIIAELPFLVALGSVEKSPLEIISVEWPRGGFIRALKESGEFTVLGLCKEGDTVRLIKRTNATGIVGINPNPVQRDAVVTVSAGEQGRYSVLLVDAVGRPLSTLFEDTLAPGRHEIALPAALLPSGQYFIVLMNGQQTHSRAVIIGK
ncbi:MAG: T9SS type A sorting domain-containing protein [Candidatus Kapabacteria bacterium]|nr:T9SS type A sorting domain-containing protein [Candidatus Kapabacteria bacterium]